MRASGGPAPFCAGCRWDQERTEIEAVQVAMFLRTAGRGAIDTETIARCSNW